MTIYGTLKTNNGSLSLKDYCTQELNWSSTVYNRTFTATEREVLTKSPTSSEFVCDITLLFKMIMYGLGNLADPIKKQLRELKNLRNTVCHEDLNMNETELRQRMADLKDVCRIILEGTAQLTGVDVSSTIADVESGLQDLVEAKLEASDIQSYIQDLANFRQEKHSKMITEGRKELMIIYSKVKILNPCSWLSDSKFLAYTIDNVFTTLKVSESGTRIRMNEILNVTSLKQRFIPRLIIIRGVMGSGKTSLYRYLLNQWCKRSPAVSGLMVVDIVIGIEMRTISCTSLVQFLREQLLINTSRLFNESDIIPVLQEMNVLFVVDGMDEATSQGKAIVKEIVNKFKDNYIIITTRPEFTLELMQLEEGHIVLDLEGFDDESQKLYVEKVFTIKYSEKQRREDEISQFLSYKSSAGDSLSTHLSLPLTLALMLVLWCDDSLKVTSVNTTTRLYQKIYEMCQQKLSKRLESRGEGHAASLSLKVREWMLELGHIAWDMMCEEVLNLCQKRTDYLMDLCNKKGIDPIQTMSTFLNCEVKESVTGTTYQFSFHHSSGAEFLSATYISEQVATLKSLDKVVDIQDKTCSRMKEILLYVAGLLKLNDKMTSPLASQIKCMLVSCLGGQTDDPLTWSRLLMETENDASVSQIVGSIVNQAKLWVINSWDPQETIEAKLSLLEKTCAAPYEVVIHVLYTTSFSQCSELQRILKLLGHIGKSKVRLSLEEQFNSSGNKQEFDDYVVPLLKLNQLLDFKGHAGQAFTSELVNATRIQSLFIRITSLEALRHLQLSTRKHRRWKSRMRPSRKWALRYLELFLDIDTSVQASDVPSLKYYKSLIVKMAGVNDSSASWAGEVLNRLNSGYTSVILQASSLTLAGMKLFLKAADDVDIKNVRVMSDQPAAYEDVQNLSQKSGVKIGWGGN